MWGYNGGSNEHYGALEVVEGDDPKYIYGQSFGYGDILEKGKIPNNMVYPNFEAGEINQEGTWAGTVESDTLDSNLIRIGVKKRPTIFNLADRVTLRLFYEWFGRLLSIFVITRRPL